MVLYETLFSCLSGVVGVTLVVGGAWCAGWRGRARAARRDYAFSQLPSEDKRPLVDGESGYGIFFCYSLILSSFNIYSAYM